MSNNVTLVTHPDMYISQDALTLLVVGLSNHAVTDIIRFAAMQETKTVIFTASVDSSFEWISTVAQMSDHIFVDISNHKHSLVTGFLLNNSNTHYMGHLGVELASTEVVDPMIELVRIYTEDP